MTRGMTSGPGRGAGLIAALALAILLVGGPHPATAQELSIVVLVNDDPISDYDIEQRERFLAITTKAEPGPELKKQATDMLIDERLQIQEGKKLGATPDDADVRKILDDMASKNNLDAEGLTTALAKAGVNVKTLKDRIRAQLVWQDVVRRKFRRDILIGDAEVDEALSDAGEEAPSGEPAGTALQLRQVKFTLPSGADQRTIASRLAAAETVRSRFNSCANLGDLTKGIQGASVQNLADQQAASLVQPARLLVQHAKVGQMTPPTLTGSAVELYAVCGKRAINADNPKREETQRKLMNEEMGIRAERLLRDLRQDAFIEYRKS
ncbi:MAG: SurA N-terminal domain-containing protein [Methyloceanibacter sp.]|uniref:SurA N-terminal domain-containing protein n=1 Tax=Methyloceanibacter sp. TaxID=1965321 RepID=UPI003D9BD20B